MQLGTLTQDVSRALRELRQGRLDYRLGKDAMVRAAVGKVRPSGARAVVYVTVCAEA